MCGRARCTLRPDQVLKACGLDTSSLPTLQMDRYHPSFNISPGSFLPVVRKEGVSGKDVIMHCMKWGLIPSFTKKREKPDHFRMFNARSESVCEKASFRRLVPNNRCLVAVEGFYEWKKDGMRKQPYYIHFKDLRPLVFAALYDCWENSEGEVFHTFTILTTCCSSALQWLHDRMPVILGNKSAMDQWLNGSFSFKVENVLKPYEDSDLVWYAVTPEMGKPSFNGPECIKEIQLKPQENLISKFFSKTSKVKQESLSQVEGSEAVKTGLSGCLEEEPMALEIKKVKEEPLSEIMESSEAVKINLCGRMKEESVIHECKKLVIDLDSDENDEKSDTQTLLNEGAENHGTKREHKELAAQCQLPDTLKKPSPLSNSKKKKENPKSAECGQQTLLSYFGKR